MGTLKYLDFDVIFTPDKNFTVKLVPLNTINYEHRDSTSSRYCQLVDKLNHTKKVYPIIVWPTYENKNEYKIEDGNHKCNYFNSLGVEEIYAKIPTESYLKKLLNI